MGRVSISEVRSARTHSSAEIEIYRPNARIEALGHAWGPGGSATSEEPETTRRACYRALELACALVKSRPESPTYPRGEDKNALACHGKSWQIAEHRWGGANPNQEGAKFVPEDPKTTPSPSPKKVVNGAM